MVSPRSKNYQCQDTSVAEIVPLSSTVILNFLVLPEVEDLTIKFGDHIERATRMLIKEMFDYIKEDLINTNSVRYL